MLPDLPTLKDELQEIFIHYLRTQTIQRLGFIGEIPRHIIHEGERMRTLRADGSIEDSELRSSSSELKINYGDIPTLSPEERFKQFDRMAEEMAKQISKKFYGTLDKTLKDAGQVVDQKKKPFDAESILAVLDSIEIEFDEDGQHKNLSMVIPPEMEEKVRRAFEHLKSDPLLSARHDELMMRKKAECRDREASRKLVG